MKTSSDTTFETLKDQLAHKISGHRITAGSGTRGLLSIDIVDGVTRTFKAHWTGFKAIYPGRVLKLRAELNDGSFWTEGYISCDQASWVLSFRKDPPKDRHTGGPRPDDKFASQDSVDVSLAFRQDLIDQGVIQKEEIIRYEDFDDPEEAIEQFFNYTSFYVLKSVGVSWSEFGYSALPSVGWDPEKERFAALPIDSAIDEGLKRSDIIWVTLDTGGGEPVPCWFLYTKEKRLFVLSAESTQMIPGAASALIATVATRWKGRDVLLAEFRASVRVISPDQADEFRAVGEQLANKRQSVVGTVEENIARWMRDGVILELTPFR